MHGPSQETYESSQESFGPSQGISSEPGLSEEILSEAADVSPSLAQQIYDPEKASQDISEDSERAMHLGKKLFLHLRRPQNRNIRMVHGLSDIRGKSFHAGFLVRLKKKFLRYSSLIYLYTQPTNVTRYLTSN